jgi:hypothetical protein
MRQAARVALLALAFGLGTWGLGWWTVPVIAVVWGAIAPRGDAPGRTAALAAALAWAALLGRTALLGPLGPLAAKVGAVFSLPGPVLLLIAIVFAATLAGAGAAATRWVVTTIRPST